nr:MAG TPA: hypothetical protein [Caudoviricetes sp.]
MKQFFCPFNTTGIFPIEGFQQFEFFSIKMYAHSGNSFLTA